MFLNENDNKNHYLNMKTAEIAEPVKKSLNFFCHGGVSRDSSENFPATFMAGFPYLLAIFQS
ncbi:hypothetical protein DDT52_14215 [Brenneria roseae subsp. roseae]|nr:hypothetical protein DDT52_14215 [Brenneria roseae subsp. roseae]